MNSAYYGEDSMIDEFMAACTAQYGKGVYLQFEDNNRTMRSVAGNREIPLLMRICCQRAHTHLMCSLNPRTA